MRKLFAALSLAVPALAVAAGGGGWKLEPAPIKPTDLASLQSGAAAAVNYCINCHSLGQVRYNALTKIGLSEAQIRDNLLFTQPKVTNMMTVAMRADDSSVWFGAPPPDLSLIARVRGVDWLYTYLRTFYRDADTATGWNNAVFPNVGMPHILWEMQGQREGRWVSEKDAHGHEVKTLRLDAPKGGTMTPLQYDTFVTDLVNFLAWAAEPDQVSRKRIGYFVLMALGVLMLLSYLLKAAFWKDVH